MYSMTSMAGSVVQAPKNCTMWGSKLTCFRIAISLRISCSVLASSAWREGATFAPSTNRHDAVWAASKVRDAKRQRWAEVSTRTGGKCYVGALLYNSIAVAHHAADHLDCDLRDPMPQGLVHLQQCGTLSLRNSKSGGLVTLVPEDSKCCALMIGSGRS